MVVLMDPMMADQWVELTVARLVEMLAVQWAVEKAPQMAVL